MREGGRKGGKVHWRVRESTIGGPCGHREREPPESDQREKDAPARCLSQASGDRDHASTGPRTCLVHRNPSTYVCPSCTAGSASPPAHSWCGITSTFVCVELS